MKPTNLPSGDQRTKEITPPVRKRVRLGAPCPLLSSRRRSVPVSFLGQIELIDLVKQRKGSTHAPKQVKFVTELPMTGVGKVDKKVLKAGFWTGRERMVG